MPTILEVLKVKTFQLHKDVESVSGVDKILNHSVNKAQFKQILNKNYMAYYLTENEINKHLNYNNDISNWIKSDLLDIMPKLPKLNYSIDNEFEALGAKYVLEGSLLGGKFISNHLIKCEYLDTETDYKFYSNTDKKRIQRWLSFKEELNAKTFNPSETESIIKGANKTFNEFKTIFKTELV